MVIIKQVKELEQSIARGRESGEKMTIAGKRLEANQNGFRILRERMAA